MYCYINYKINFLNIFLCFVILIFHYILFLTSFIWYIFFVRKILYLSFNVAVLTFMDDKLSGIWWRRRKFFSNMYERVFFDTSGWDLQWIFSFKETGPWRIQPVLVLNVCLLPSVVICLLADLLVFAFDILKRIIIFIVKIII